MKDISELYTPAEVDARIDEICRNMPGLRAKVESGDYTAAERASDPKVDAVCRALERRAELEGEITRGERAPTGEVHHHV